MRTLLCLLLPLLAVLLPAGADEAPALKPDQPYQVRKSNPVTYEVDFAVTVTAPYHTHVLKVWLPMATSDSAQEVEDGAITTFPMKVTPRIGVEKKFGNRFAYFEFKDPQGAQIIRRKFTVKVPELHWDVDPAKVKTPAAWPGAFTPYLEGDHSVAVDDPLKELLPKVVPDRGNPASELASVLDWVNANMTYDHNNASLKASSKHALTQR